MITVFLGHTAPTFQLVLVYRRVYYLVVCVLPIVGHHDDTIPALYSSVIWNHFEPVAPTPRTASLSRTGHILPETSQYTSGQPDGKGVPPLHWIDRNCWSQGCDQETVILCLENGVCGNSSPRVQQRRASRRCSRRDEKLPARGEQGYHRSGPENAKEEHA